MAKIAREAPADVRVMAVVHSALRRDLVRARIVVAAEDVDTTRRTALGRHLLWLMTTLHRHHQGEERALFPLVVERHPAAAALVAVMGAEHVAVVPAMSALQEAARDYRDGAEGSRAELLTALATLDAVLLPHLGREETELMPLVAGPGDQLWHAWDTPTESASGKPARVAFERHWLLDGVDPEARSALLGRLPLVARLELVVHRRRYARRARTLWSGTPATEVPSLTLAELPTWS